MHTVFHNKNHLEVVTLSFIHLIEIRVIIYHLLKQIIAVLFHLQL